MDIKIAIANLAAACLFKERGFERLLSKEEQFGKEVPLNFMDEISGISISVSFDKKIFETVGNNAIFVALGFCFLVAEEKLSNKFGNNKTKGGSTGDLNLDSLRTIIGATKNAFSHHPTEPQWDLFKDKKTGKCFYEKQWKFTLLNNKVVELDLRSKNGKKLTISDFGGIQNIFEILQFIDLL